MSPIHAYAAKDPKSSLQPFEFDPGELGQDQVEIKVSHCGICHSDLHMVGAVLEPLSVPAFGLIMGQKSVSGSPGDSPGAIDRMLEFSARHSVAPVVENFPMSKVNDAVEHLRAGKARYRIVLTNGN